MSKKKIVSVVLSVLVLISAVGLYTVNYRRHERFDYSEKSSVAMGTIITQKIYGNFTAKDTENIKAVIDGLDDMISWRKADSEIAKLNSGESIKSAYLADVIKQCSEISTLSGGVFDITVGGISQLWSIGEETQRIPGDKEISDELENVGYGKIKNSNNTVEIIF